MATLPEFPTGSFNPASKDTVKAIAKLVFDGVSSSNNLQGGPTSRIFSMTDFKYAVQHTMKEVETECLRQIANQRLERNRTRSRIYRIPDEILFKIFSAILDDDVYQSHIYEVHRLMRVCSKWYRFLVDAPAVWAKIYPCHPPKRIAEALAKSKDAPLSVLGFSDRKDYWDFVAPQVHRWRALELLLCDNIPAGTLEQPAPLLRKLAIRNNPSRERYPPKLNLFGSRAPGLDDLSIAGVILDWTAPMYSHLRYLRLKNLHLVRPPLSQILQMLGSSPNLLELVLSSIEFADDLDSNITPPTSLIFTRLNSLEISHVSPQHTHLLLTLMQAPSCSSLVLRCSSRLKDVASPMFDSSISHWALVAQKCLSRSKYLEVSIEPRRSIICRASRKESPLEDPPLEIICSGRHINPFSVLDWITDEVHPERYSLQTSLRLTTGGGHCNLLNPEAYSLFKLSNTSSISMRVAPRKSNVMQRMARRIRINGVMQWPFSRLESFEIDPAADDKGGYAEDVLEMVRGRYSCDGDDKGPMRLTHLSFPVAADDEDTLKAMDDVLGASPVGSDAAVDMALGDPTDQEDAF